MTFNPFGYHILMMLKKTLEYWKPQTFRIAFPYPLDVFGYSIILNLLIQPTKRIDPICTSTLHGCVNIKKCVAFIQIFTLLIKHPAVSEFIFLLTFNISLQYYLYDPEGGNNYLNIHELESLDEFTLANQSHTLSWQRIRSM